MEGDLDKYQSLLLGCLSNESAEYFFDFSKNMLQLLPLSARLRDQMATSNAFQILFRKMINHPNAQMITMLFLFVVTIVKDNITHKVSLSESTELYLFNIIVESNILNLPIQEVLFMQLIQSATTQFDEDSTIIVYQSFIHVFIKCLSYNALFSDLKNKYLDHFQTMFRDKRNIRILSAVTFAKNIITPLLENSITDSELQSKFIDIAKLLMHNGIPDPILKLIVTSIGTQKDNLSILYDILIYGLREGSSPNFLEFSVLKNTHASIMYPIFKSAFPPNYGYSFMSWIKIDSPNALIYTIIDDEKAIRFQLRVQDRVLKIQTLKMTVFTKITITLSEWSHIAIVHHKPKLMPSYVDVFLNGAKVEQLRCAYLGHPHTAKSAYSYFGVPFDAKGSYQNAFSIQIGPSYFIQETLLTEESVKTVFNLGYDYEANLQDINNAYVSPSFVNRKSSLMPRDFGSSAQGRLNIGSACDEENILIGLFAKNHVLKLKNTGILIMNEHSDSDVLNSSLIPIPGAISGNVTSVNPNFLTKSIWKLGASHLLLKLLDSSSTTESLFLSSTFLVEALSNSRRLIKDMEDGMYYEVVAHILTTKASLLTIPIIEVYLDLIGRNIVKPQESKIMNYDAYSQLFLNPCIWNVSSELAIFYLQHFEIFITKSSFRTDNLRKILVIKYANDFNSRVLVLFEY